MNTNAIATEILKEADIYMDEKKSKEISDFIYKYLIGQVHKSDILREIEKVIGNDEELFKQLTLKLSVLATGLSTAGFKFRHK